MTIEICGATQITLYDPGSHTEDSGKICEPKSFKVDRREIVYCNWASGNHVSVLLKNGWMIHIKMPDIEKKNILYDVLMDAPTRFQAQEDE